MKESDKPLTLSQMRELSRDGGAASGFSPLAPQPYLLFEAVGRPLSAADSLQLAQWLRGLCVPVIGVLPLRGFAVLRKACDVVLKTREDLEVLTGNIARRPLASAVFVQLLRASESLPIAEALIAESLAYATLQSGPEYRHWLASAKPEPTPITDSGLPILMERDGATLLLELNRPSNRNAISVEVRDALAEALQLVLSDPSLRKVQISGRGKCFSVGGDLAEFGDVPDPVTGHVVRSLVLPGRLLAQCAKRVEVRLHGACIGAGIEFPAFAQRVVADPATFFQLPELKFGLIPGAGGCVSIARRIGRQRLARWVIAGTRINARRALDWGLVDAIRPRGKHPKNGARLEFTRVSGRTSG